MHEHTAAMQQREIFLALLLLCFFLLLFFANSSFSRSIKRIEYTVEWAKPIVNWQFRINIVHETVFLSLSFSLVLSFFLFFAQHYITFQKVVVESAEMASYCFWNSIVGFSHWGILWASKCYAFCIPPNVNRVIENVLCANVYVFLAASIEL